MPRKKRSRRHKKHHNNRNHFRGDKDEPQAQFDQMRTCMALDSPVDVAAKIGEELGVKISMKTPSPDLNLVNLSKIPRSRSSCTVTNSPGRKRRSVSRESNLGCSGLPFMFNLSERVESFISDLRTCQSSTILETRGQSDTPRSKCRSSSSMAKLHSPGIEKVPLKAETSTQTREDLEVGFIIETPRVDHDALLEFDYKVELLRNTPVSGYRTPLKRMRFDSVTPIFDVKDTAVCIQDLNNLQNEQTGHKVLNCSRTLNGNSLKRLQNFNELILNTSQSVDYDNCELSPEIAEIQAVTHEDHVEINGNDVSDEISFFTPQLYNCKSASTPIEKNDAKIRKDESTPIETVPNKVEILKNETVDARTIARRSVSTSTQVENRIVHDVGVQTLSGETKVSLVPKSRSPKAKHFSVAKRRTYKSLSPAVMYYRASPKRDFRHSPMRRVSLEKSDSVDRISAFETCARIIAKIKKYHGRYSSKLPAKIVEICTWLGLTIKKGVTSLYKLYAQQRTSNESTCNKCNFYLTQISALTSTVDGLGAEINRMKQEYKEDSEKISKLSLLRSEVDQLRRELNQFESLKTDLLEIKERLAGKPTIASPPPPPPPPPPPLLAPSNLLINNRPIKVAVKKSNENGRPIISLDDILKVKLKKVGERPSPMQRRATEPLVLPSTLRQIKLRSTISRPQTPSSNGSLSGSSSLSNSPRSSLTRILTNVDTNEKST